MLGAGTLLASWMGTTGAAMLLIRTVIRANDGAPLQRHMFVFFIFLVVEYRRRADAARRSAAVPRLPARASTSSGRPSTCCRRRCCRRRSLLAVFFLLDCCSTAARSAPRAAAAPRRRLQDRGAGSTSCFLAGIVVAVMLSGSLDPAPAFTVHGIAGRAADRCCATSRCWRWSPRLANAHADGGARRATSSPGARSSRWRSCSPASSSRSSRRWRCCGPARRRVRARRRAGQTARRQADRCDVFLADRRPVELPRQRADLSRVLQRRGRRSAAPDGTARDDADGDLRRRGVHGRQHLYRQRAQLHGQVRSRRTPAIRMPSFFGYMGWSLAVLIPVFMLVETVFF